MSRTSLGVSAVQDLRALAVVVAAVVAIGPLAVGQTLPDWISRSLAPRSAPAMAWDSARERAVLFGGQDAAGPGFADTWEWDGTRWSQRFPSRHPPGPGEAMVYDTARRCCVLFRAGTTGETWEWDGDDWELRVAAVNPPGRVRCAMAYDSSRGRAVLFGGQDGASVLSAETWEWDGTHWQQRLPATSPPRRAVHALAYDAARQRTVLFGGRTDAGLQADTWEWDGTDWTQRATTTQPTARSGHAMAYDTLQQRVFLWAGLDQAFDTGDTWDWDGTRWTLREAHDRFRMRWDSGLAYDGARRQLVRFGGVNTSGFAAPDAFLWNGSTWLQHAPALADAVRGHAIAYDPARQRVLRFGGEDAARLLVDHTWQWDGVKWTRSTPPVAPAPRAWPAMAWDAARQRVVLFGGSIQGAPGVSDETWEWDGSTWTREQPALSPPARQAHAMAYDSGRGRVVLFGGADAARAPLADTWEWDGQTWLQCSPATRPEARMDHTLVYDPGRGRVVLFGGSIYRFNEMQVFGDTWEWDGTAWTRPILTSGPPARARHCMAYDAARQRAVLFGGSDAAGWAPLDDTWEWDGSRASWSQAFPTTRPLRRLDAALAFDAARGRIVLFAGSAGALRNHVAGTWLYGPLERAQTLLYGSACAGSNGPPVLAAPEPFLGNSAFALDLLSARAAAPFLLGFGVTPLSLPVGGGCTLSLDPLVLVPGLVANGAGFASTRLPLPADPAFRGAVFYAQAFVVDPGAAIGLALTAGCRFQLGD